MTYTNGDTDTFTVTNGQDGASQWGQITGTLSNQTDLQTVLNGKLDITKLEGTSSNPIDLATLEPGEYLLKGNLRKSNSESTIEDDWTLYEVTIFGEQNEGKAVSNKYASTYFTKSGNQYVYDFEANVISDIQLDNYLTDYVKNTDYASSNSAGVILTNEDYGTQVNLNGVLTGVSVDYNVYNSEFFREDGVISKGTLENAITGKGLVSNTDYATDSVGGVFKLGNRVFLNSSGVVGCSTRTYTQYSTDSDSSFIGKGTLENVLTARIGDIETLLEVLDVGSGARELA